MIPVIIQHADGRISEVTSDLVMSQTVDPKGNMAFTFENTPTLKTYTPDKGPIRPEYRYYINYNINIAPFILDNQLIIVITNDYNTEIKNLTTGYSHQLAGVFTFSLQTFEGINYLISSNNHVFYCPSLWDEALYTYSDCVTLCDCFLIRTNDCIRYANSNFSLKKYENNYFLFATNYDNTISGLFDLKKKEFFKWYNNFSTVENISIQTINDQTCFVDKKRFNIYTKTGACL